MPGSDSEDDLESLRLAALRSMQPPGAVRGFAGASCQQPSRRGGSSMPLLATAPPRPALLHHQSRPAVWQSQTTGPPPGTLPPGVWMNQQQQLPPPHQPPPHLQQHPPPHQQPNFSRLPPLLAHPLLSTLQQLLPSQQLMQQPFQLMQQPQQQLHRYPHPTSSNSAGYRQRLPISSSNSAGYRQQLPISRRGLRGSWHSNATSRLQTPSRRPIAADTAPVSRASNRSNARRLHKNERSKFGRIDHSDSEEEDEDEVSSTASASAPSTAEVDDSVVPPTSTPAVEASATEVASSTANLTKAMSVESAVNSVKTTETSTPVSDLKRTSTTPDPAASSQAAAEALSTEDDDEEDDDADVIDMGIGDDDFDKMLAEFEDFVDNPQLKGSVKSSGANTTTGGMSRKRRRKDHRGSTGRETGDDPSDVRLKLTSNSKTAGLDKQNARREPAKSSGASQSKNTGVSSDPPVLDTISPPGPNDKSSLGRIGHSPTASRRPTSPARRPRSPLLGRAPPQHLRHPLSPGRRGLPLSPARARRLSPQPRRSSPPPRRLSPQPRRSSPPPRRLSPPPRRLSPPPRRMSPFPRRPSPPLRRFSPPPRRFSPPPIHLSPFSRRLSPPPRRFSPPSPLRRSTLSPERRRSPPAPIALTQDEFIRRIQLGLPLRDSSPSTYRRSVSRSPSRRRVSLSPPPSMAGPVMSRRMRSPEQRTRRRSQLGRSTSPPSGEPSSSLATARTRSTSPASSSWRRGHSARGDRRLASPPLSTTNRAADRRQQERVDVRRAEEERRRKLQEEEERRRKLQEEEEHRKKQQEEEKKKKAKEEADKTEFEERLKRLSTPDRERVLKRQAKFQRNVPITGQPKTIRLGCTSSAGAQQLHPQAPVSVSSACQKPGSAANSPRAAVGAETDTQQSEESADQLLHQLDEELAALEAELLTESTPVNGVPTSVTTAEVAVEKKPARVHITMDPASDQRTSYGVVVKQKHRPKDLSPDLSSDAPAPVLISPLKARSGKRRRREHSARESGSRRVVVVASSLEPDATADKPLKHKQDSSLESSVIAALPERRAPLVISKSSGQKTLDSSVRSIFSRLGSAVVADAGCSSDAVPEGGRSISMKRKRRSEVLAPQDSDRRGLADDGGIIGAKARRNVIATDPIRHHLRKVHARSSAVSKRRRKGVSGVDSELHRRDKYD